MVIETKVSLPAIVVAVLWSLGGAAYAVAKAYGFDPTPEQNAALLGLAAALQYALQVTVGYLAPHTHIRSAPPFIPSDAHTHMQSAQDPSSSTIVPLS